MASLRELRERLDALSDAYAKEYAGRRRDTRDLARLDRMIADARSIVAVLERRLGPLRPAERDVLDRARGQVALFTKDRAAITEVKAQPPIAPEEVLLRALATRAIVAVGLLRRAFHEGADRVDLALLTEIIELLEAVERGMVERVPSAPRPWIVENLSGIRMDLATCRRQHLGLVEAWSSGDEASRLGYLRALAENKIALWDADVDGIPTEVRRPTRLRHVAAALRTIADRIRAVGSLTAADVDVLAEIEQRAEVIEAERAGLVAAREAATPDSIARILDGEIATVRRLYKENFAGRARRDVSLPLLGGLIAPLLRRPASRGSPGAKVV